MLKNLFEEIAEDNNANDVQVWNLAEIGLVTSLLAKARNPIVYDVCCAGTSYLPLLMPDTPPE